MAGKAKFKKTYGTKLKDQTAGIKQLYSLAGSTGSPRASTMSFGVAGGSSTPPAIDEYARLKTQGDSMIGAIAYYPKITVIDGSGEIDVVQGGVGALDDDYTSYLIVTPVGVADDLVTINGVSHAGQLLHLEANSTGTITLKHDTGNIFIPSEADFTIEAGGFATLIYDIAIHPNKWVLVSSSSTGGWSGNATSDLDMNTFDIIDVDRLQFTSDSGVGIDNTKVGMYANANTDAVINFPDTKDFLWTQNGQYFLTVDEDGLVPRLDDDWSIGTGAYQLKDLQTKLWTADQGTIKQYLNMTNTGAGGDHYAYVVGQMTSVYNGASSLGSSTEYGDDYDHYWYRTSTRVLDLQSGQSTAPSHAGEFRLDGTDVKVYTGGGVKSLTDIGTGGGGADTSLSNLVTAGETHYDSRYARKESGQSVIISADWTMAGDTTLGNQTTDTVEVMGKLDFTGNYTTQYYASHPAVTGFIQVETPDGTKNLWFS